MKGSIYKVQICFSFILITKTETIVNEGGKSIMDF